MRSKRSWLVGPFLYALLFLNSAHATTRLPFTLGVRDSLMIAHSFHGNTAFGPAKNMVCISISYNNFA